MDLTTVLRPLVSKLLWPVSASLLMGILLCGPVDAQDLRKWKDASGRFEIEARFSRLDGKNVVLEKADGSMITVPLDKLSPIDQGYVEGRRSTNKSDPDNPFKTMSGGSSSTGGSASGTTSSSASATDSSNDPGEVRELKVDYQTAPQTTITAGNWNPSLPAQPSPPTMQAVSLQRKSGFWERFARAAINLKAQRAVLTHHFGKPGGSPTTRMELVDLESGKTIANASGEGKWAALAVHDDGERIVVQNMSDAKETMGQLGTVRLKGSKIVPLDLWKPYESMSQPPKEQIVRFCRFINNGRLLTLSQNGHVVIWDFDSRQPVRRFNYHGACQPSLTYDRKYLAICGGDIFGIVNLEDDSEPPSVKAAPQMNYWLSSAFSPSCKRFAAATMGKLMVWDVDSGDVLFEGKIPGLATNGKLFFPHEDFVMVNNDKLVEFGSGIKLWRYHGAAPVTAGGTMMYVHTSDKGGKMLPVNLPHPEALNMLAEAKAQSDLFILKKGAQVSLDLSGVPGQYRGEVETSLKENLDRMGFVYANAAPVSLKASISGPTNEAVSYHFAGSFVVRQFKSNLSIQYEGKSLWARSATNTPGMVSGRDKEDIKKQLDKAGQRPNIRFFSSTQLPDFMQKPTGDGKNQDQQMLGSTVINGNGLAQQ